MADKRPLSIYSGIPKEISDTDVSEIPGLKCIGGVSYSVVTKIGTYTTTLSDHTIRCNSTSDFTIALHSAASAYNSTDNTGQELVFKNVNSGTVTIDANSTETIDGKNTVSIAQYGTLTLRSNGTNWDIVGNAVATQRDYALLTMSANQTADVSIGDPIKFDTIDTNNLSLSSYKVTLKAGKTYMLTAESLITFDSTANARAQLQWHDGTSYIGKRSMSIRPDSTALEFNEAPTAWAVVTPLVDTEYELRIVFLEGSISAVNNLFSTAYIEEIASYEGNGLRKYTTGWVACSDWTNQKLGTTLGGNVVHNLGRSLKDLHVKVLYSSDGTDANSYELLPSMYNSGEYGYGIKQVDSLNNSIIVSTATAGTLYLDPTDGDIEILTNQSGYYKIEVYDLLSAGGDSYWSQDDNDVEYTSGSVNLNTLKLLERSSDPGTPDEGSSYIWQSDGTGSGDDGDIMVKITAGGTTKTTTLIDFSTL